MARYCSSECQKEDWKKEHKEKCKRRLSIVYKAERKFDECTFCGEDDCTPKICSGCRFVCYCSSMCQQKDWQKHRVVCRHLDPEFLPKWRNLDLYCAIHPLYKYREFGDFYVPITADELPFVSGKVPPMSCGVIDSDIEWEIPVALYPRGVISLTIISRSGKELWRTDLFFDCPSPSTRLAELIREQTYQASIKELSGEPWITGPTYDLTLGSVSGLEVKLSVTRVTRPSGEPLSVLIDKVWAVTSISVHLPEPALEVVRRKISQY